MADPMIGLFCFPKNTYKTQEKTLNKQPQFSILTSQFSVILA